MIFDIRNPEILQAFQESLQIGKFVNYIDSDGQFIFDLEQKEVQISFDKPVKFKVFFDQIRKIQFLLKIFIMIKPSKVSLDHYSTNENKSFLQLKFPLAKGETSEFKSFSHLSLYITCLNPKPEYGFVALQPMITFYPKLLNQNAFQQCFKFDKLLIKPDTLIELTNLKNSKITYASIMDGEDAKYVTFISKSRDEIIINYRDRFDFSFNIINEGEYLFSIDIYDKGQRQETYIRQEQVQHLFPFELPDFKNLAHHLMIRTNGADYTSPNPLCLQIRTNDYILMHKALKRLFDYCGCIYLVMRIRECKVWRNDEN